ncbi:hemin uptake protein HemP [Xylophilus sp. Kf1]|nr:hemin uptake protein HemP [Xylophilus sp. Kf1]
MPAQANVSPSRQLNPARHILSLQAVVAHEDAGDDEPADCPLTSILSSDLLQGQKVVSIHHNGSTYRLQATRLGKLILTK